MFKVTIALFLISCHKITPNFTFSQKLQVTRVISVLVSSSLQDTLGGGFDATQAFVGDLANFHIWDRKLSVGEIYNLATCSSKAQVGNVFAWMETSLDIYGGASKWTFEACRQLNWTAGRKTLNAFAQSPCCHSIGTLMWRRLDEMIFFNPLGSGHWGNKGTSCGAWMHVRPTCAMPL